MILAFALHVLFAVLWVGGMFFAYVCLRPAVADYGAQAKTTLWAAVLGRFFSVVLLAIPVLLATGIYLIHLYGGMAHVGLHVHLMLGLGILMMLMFFHVFFAPFKRLKRAVAAGDFETGAKQVQQLRMLVGINLALGLIVVLVAAAGRYLPTGS